MRRSSYFRFGFGSLLGLVAVTAAHAQSTGLTDLVGARAGQAEGELQARGYRWVRTEKGDDRSYAYWWSADRRQCVTVATMDGRYSAITPTTAPDCRQPAGGSSPARYGPPPPTLYGPDARLARQEDSPRGDRFAAPDGDGAVVDGRPVDLGLVCFGDGQKDGVATGTEWSWNRKKDRYEYGTYNQATTDQFDASLTVQLWSGGGRIRLPKSLVPPLNSNGSDGWWSLYDVSVGPDVIRASYRLNALNKPHVEIDRRTGAISVEGFSNYAFHGRCDQIGNEPRRF